METTQRDSWTRQRLNRHRFEAGRTALALSLLIYSIGAAGLEVDTRGYVGYVGVSVDENVLCDSRACQGVLADSLFYGLSLSLQGEELGAQLVVAQDDEEDPELSVAQIMGRTGFGGVEISARLGKIIVPLGLYGSQRITPTARPGLVLPQSFLLNTYYDLLTLSEKGLAVQLNSEAWTVKAAAFKPRKEVVERIIQSPGGPIPPGEQTNFLQGTLSLLFGNILNVPGSGGTVTVVEHRNFDGGYIGLSHQGERSNTDLGLVRLDLNGSRLEALNLGNAWILGVWEPSIELFRLKFVDSGNRLNGASANLTYSAEKWQAFGNGVFMEVEGNDSREYALGGAYYWNDNWSSLLAIRQLEGDISNVNEADDKVKSVSLSLAYSWH